MKLYIAVLDEFPDYMTPTLVAHSMLAAHIKWFKFNYDDILGYSEYMDWLQNSFKKVTVRVNQKEFDKIAALPDTYLGHENSTLEGRKSCAIAFPCDTKDLPNVLKFAKTWKPKDA